MIGRLSGTLLEKNPPAILLNVQGVGYEVDVPMSTFYGLPELGQAIELHTHFVVREDAQLLFGFATTRERALFRALLKVNGVGAKVALSILSGLTAEEFFNCVAQKDVVALTKVPGIGKKTAERLLVEMQDKVDALAGGSIQAGLPVNDSGSPRAQATDALMALGYKSAEAKRLLDKTASDEQSVEDMIRAALRGVSGVIMTEDDRLISAEPRSDDAQERAMRPKRLADYRGQDAVAEQMSLFIEAAKMRSEALDHVLLFGPPGLGKTTLANIIANELDVRMLHTSGPVLERPGDLAAILTNLEANDVLFIDEIHRMSPVVEEVLYPAMEDYQIDIMTGEGVSARSFKIDLPPFTLVGATTRAGLLTAPLRDRFGIVQRLEFYSAPDLANIVARSARLLEAVIDDGGCQEIARRARGTPRIANRLLRRVRDYSDVKTGGKIDAKAADAALNMLKVDKLGLDSMDRRLLFAIIDKFNGGPVGVDNLGAALSEEAGTIEEVIEPYLIQQGLMMRTPRGRVATANAYRIFSLEMPEGKSL